MASRIKDRARARNASIAAILGAATVLVAACETEEGVAPPVDFDARADRTGEGDHSVEASAEATAEADSTLVDLDGEADSGNFHLDAARDHEGGNGGSGSSGGGSSAGGSSTGGSSGEGSSGASSSGGGSSGSSGEIS
jgi:hypothetical protein